MQRSDWWIVTAVVLFVAAVLSGAVTVASTMPTQSVGVGTILSGVATLILAGLTAIILIVNARVLRATKEAAEATRDAARATKAEADATLEEAKATREQAEATKEQSKIAAKSLEELRRNRELEWQPFLLHGEATNGTGISGRAFRDVVVYNIGRGPALNVLYVREERATGRHGFLTTAAFNLGASASLDIRAVEQDQPPHPALFHRHELPRELLLCQDQFGNTFRFVPGFAEPTIWTRLQDEGGVGEEPGWVRGMKEVLHAGRPEPEPQPGPYFAGVISVQGATRGMCDSTVGLEAVPATEEKISDAMRDGFERWVHTLEPRAKPFSPDIAHWQWEISGKVASDFTAKLDPGPAISVRRLLELNGRPPLGGASPEADLPLLDLVTWWKRITEEGMALMKQFRVAQLRLGLAIVTSGTWDQPRLANVNFVGLPQPKPWMEVPVHQIRNWAYPPSLFESKPFDIETFPLADLEAAVRSLLRIFGYRDVDGVISALKLQAPPGVSTGDPSH